MSDNQEYINKSINSLVQQLNSLGNKSILMSKTQLMFIQRSESKNIRRFQNKSIIKRQFFKLNRMEKKYYYDHVTTHLNEQILKQFMTNWQQGYNTTIVIQNHLKYIIQLIKIITKWTTDCLTYCIILDHHNNLVDILGQSVITHRELLSNNKYYELPSSSSTKNKLDVMITYLKEYLMSQIHQRNQNKDNMLFVDITFKNRINNAELHVTALPIEMFKNECKAPYSLVKTQLLQLLNYIKINPNKRYQHISKLITKRLPITNYLTRILMNDSCNLIINIVQQNNYQQQNEECIGRFQMFDKLAIVKNLLRKPDLVTIEIGVIKPLPIKRVQQFTNNNNNNHNHVDTLTLTKTRNSKHNNNNQLISRIDEQFVSPITKLNLKTEYTSQQKNNILVKQKEIQQKQFEFCRSLQRKTHKYSISPLQQEINNQSKEKPRQLGNDYNQPSNTIIKDKKTLTRYHSIQGLHQFDNLKINQQQHHPITSLKQPVSQSQQITLLKAQHAREISQYHQTIQLLNKKIMILTKQLNLQELYKIHQREIMLLECKIKELREDVSILTREDANNNQLKSMVNKLTSELQNHQQTSISKQYSQSRLFMVQKQLLQTKQKLSTSEKARSLLNLQVQTLTKRLKIRDLEIQKINNQDRQKYQCDELSVTEEQLLEEIKKLVIAVKNQQRNSSEFLLRKISFILSDLSKSRDIILQCNDFLVQLMQLLDHKMSKKQPQIVLNCNKFIRSFLMNNLAIF